jgi:hypothetical protein
MNRFAALLVVSLALAACVQGAGVITNARMALHVFCTLKQTEIAQVLLTEQQLQAGRVVCSAIGDPLGIGG